MRTDELKLKMATQGLQAEEPRLREWATAKLIPEPKVTEDELSWPSEAWWQASVACYLLDNMGWTTIEVRTARFYMEAPILAGASPIAKLDWFFVGDPLFVEGNQENYVDSFAWAVAAIKARSNWPLNAPAEITVVHRSGSDKNRKFEIVNRRDQQASGSYIPHDDWKFEQSLKDVIRDAETGSIHPRPVEPLEAEIIG